MSFDTDGWLGQLGSATPTERLNALRAAEEEISALEREVFVPGAKVKLWGLLPAEIMSVRVPTAAETYDGVAPGVWLRFEDAELSEAAYRLSELVLAE